MAALAGIARAAGVPVHMDGARFANALAALGCTPAELTWKAGVDALSFGGTKNGCLGVEAVILFDPARAWEFELRRKRGGHLFSKHRFLSAQMEAYLADELWLELAARANARAATLAAGIAALPGAALVHPTEANAVFAAWPRAGHRAARRRARTTTSGRASQSLDGPDDEPLSARLVCNWATTEAEVAAFLGVLPDGSDGDRATGPGWPIDSMPVRRVAARRQRAAQVRLEERQAVLAPEDLLADDVARRAEDAAADRLVGVALQRLDRGQQAAVGERRVEARRARMSRTTSSSAMSRSSAQTARRKPCTSAPTSPPPAACAEMIAAEAGTGLVGKCRGLEVDRHARWRGRRGRCPAAGTSAARGGGP